MDRAVRLVALVLLVLAWASSHADTPGDVTKFGGDYCTSSSCSPVVHEDKYAVGIGTAVQQGLCSPFSGMYWFQGDTFAGWGAIGGGITTCRYEHCTSGVAGCNSYLAMGSYSNVYGCLVGGVFTPAGSGSCVNPCVADPVGAQVVRWQSSSAASLVRNHCVYNRSFGASCDVVKYSVPYNNGAADIVECWYYNSGTASSSADTDVPSGAATTATACPSGQVYGTVNGTPTCLPSSGSAATTTKTDTVKNAAGTTTGSTTTSTTTINNTTNNTTTVSTTVTTYDGAGNVTGSTTTANTKPLDTADMSNFCKEHPDLDICKVSSFTGTCGSAFSGTGDAVEVAIAKEIYTRNCALFVTATALSDLGNAAAAGTDTGTTGNPALAGNRETRAVGSLDQTAFLSAGALVDVTYAIGTFHGHDFSVTVPYSSLVTLLTWLGVLAVGLTLVWAARFVLS